MSWPLIKRADADVDDGVVVHGDAALIGGIGQNGVAVWNRHTFADGERGHAPDPRNREALAVLAEVRVGAQVLVDRVGVRNLAEIDRLQQVFATAWAQRAALRTTRS
jgi:hypothetical protein